VLVRERAFFLCFVKQAKKHFCNGQHDGPKSRKTDSPARAPL
jgi:hypothetical protein